MSPAHVRESRSVSWVSRTWLVSFPANVPGSGKRAVSAALATRDKQSVEVTSTILPRRHSRAKLDVAAPHRLCSHMYPDEETRVAVAAYRGYFPRADGKGPANLPFSTRNNRDSTLSH